MTAHSEQARPAVTLPSTTPTMLVIAAAWSAVEVSYLKACRAALGERLKVAPRGLRSPGPPRTSGRSR